MEQFFKHPRTLARLREGPLGSYLEAFAQQLRAQGYTCASARRQLRLAADFSRWLQAQGLTVHETTAEHTTHYLRDRAQRQRPQRDDAATLRRLCALLHAAGLIAAPPIPHVQTPAEQWLESFGVYLRQERALASPTVTSYLEFVRRFLHDQFLDGPVALAALEARDVIAFVQRQAAGLHPRRAQLMTTALRAFFRYARYQGDLLLDLAAAVPTVATWTKASLPRSLTLEQVERVLAHCNRQTAMGRRDYAILILLARLGLRAGEIVALRLDDIDWDTGCITVRGKGGHWSQMPLPSEVGEAIAAYVQYGRPSSASRRVFLRQRAPLVGFANSIAICTLVARALGRAGVEVPHTGAHLFRHTLATEMLRHGASLHEIGALLRHQSPQTTAIYAKVDLALLRTLAVPWPGGAS